MNLRTWTDTTFSPEQTVPSRLPSWSSQSWYGWIAPERQSLIRQNITNSVYGLAWLYTKTLRKMVVYSLSVKCIMHSSLWNYVFALFSLCGECDYFKFFSSIGLNCPNLFEQHLYLHVPIILLAGFVWNQMNFLTDFRLAVINSKHWKNQNMFSFSWNMQLHYEPIGSHKSLSLACQNTEIRSNPS